MTPLSFASAARDAPHELALISDSARYTFAELAGPVARATQWLRHARRGDGPIAFVAHRNLDTALVTYAALELGACIAPLHHKLTDHEVDARRARLAPSVWLPRGFRVPDAVWSGSEHTDHGPPPAIAKADPLAIVFTSGSTGDARGAVLSRRAFLASAEASAHNLGWYPSDRWLLSLSPAHVGGLSILVRCLAARRCVVVDTRQHFDAHHTAALLRDHQVTLWSAVPTMVSLLIDSVPAWTRPASLRAVLLGGAAPGPSLLRACAAANMPVLTTYGMTETCAQVCTQPPHTRPDASTGSGPPLGHADIRIGDGGVVEVRAASLFDGYLPPHDTAPVTDRDGFYRTGDRGMVDDEGRLHVLGRADHVIVTGGECVDPLEVETVLETFPAIREACVFGMPDATWGEIITASVVATGAVDRAALRAHLETHLARFKHPRYIHLAAALPTAAMGKRDRHAAIAAARAHLEPL